MDGQQPTRGRVPSSSIPDAGFPPPLRGLDRDVSGALMQVCPIPVATRPPRQLSYGAEPLFALSI